MKRFVFLLSALCILLTVSSAVPQDKAAPDETAEQYVNHINKETAGDTINPPFLKQDFLINTLGGESGAEQYGVTGASDGGGVTCFAWIDTRNGQTDIYAQFVDINGDKIGSNIKVSDTELPGYSHPAVAANSGGDFVIAWVKGEQQVAVQRFNKTGQKIGSNIIIDSDYFQSSYSVSAAVSDNGSFMITWFRFARLFYASGTPAEENIIFASPENVPFNSGYTRQIAADKQGDYCITWESYQFPQARILLQMINNSGQLIGVNLLFNDPAYSESSINPSVISVGDKYFMFAWDALYAYPDMGVVGSRIYNKEENSFTDINYLTDTQNTVVPYQLTSDRDSIFYLLWGGYHNMRKIGVTGEYIGNPVILTYDNTGVDYLSLGWLTEIVNDRFYAGFEGYLNSDRNIYIQEFDSGIQGIGPLERLNDDNASSEQSHPLIHFNSRGQSIVIWKDRRNGNYDLYARVLDENFNPAGPDFQLNEDTSGYHYVQAYDVKSFDDGNFIVAFTNVGEYYNKEIRFQKVNFSGEKDGGNVTVENNLYNSELNITMNVNGSDVIALCWYDRYGGTVKSFHKNLVPASLKKLFIQYSDGYLLQPFAVSVDTTLEILAVWKNHDPSGENPDRKIYGAFYDRSGNLQDSSFVIDSTYYSYIYLQCSNDNHNYLAMYEEGTAINIKRGYAEGYNYTSRLYAEYYPRSVTINNFKNRKFFITYSDDFSVHGYYVNDNNRTSSNYLLHNKTENYSADLHNGKMIFAFEDGRIGGTGTNIWGNARLLKDVSFNKELFFAPAAYDVLYNNYPNPFNPVTTISYQLLAFHKVKLAVYDILGREVRVLVDENQDRGVYEVQFDGTGLASGIYIVRLEAFNTRVKKMILLK